MGESLGRHARRMAAIWMILLLTAMALATTARPVAAQSGLSITTPYPAVSVQPGASVSFDLTVTANTSVRADVSVDGLERGWRATLSGGGNEISGVFVSRQAPASITLDVEVPDDANPGETTLTVVATGGGDTVRLPLELTIADQAGGSVSLLSDYPSLVGSADEDFQFNLTLENDTPQQLTFNLSAQAPAGWNVTVRPSGEANAASVTVDANATQRLEVTATPPADAVADRYPIQVTVAAGSYNATTDLVAEVTGNVEMEISTPDQRLNTTANAGSTRDFQVTIANNGASPLQAVSLDGSGPSEWEITFEPETVEEIPPGQVVTVTAHITPSGNAVAGDYMVTLSASTEDADESIDVRVTVETPLLWGLLGVLLIVGTLAGLVWVFRRYGRR